MKAMTRFGFTLLFTVLMNVETQSQDFRPVSLEIELTSFRLGEDEDPQIQINAVPLSLRKIDYPLSVSMLAGSSLTFPEVPPPAQSVKNFSTRANFFTAKLWLASTLGFGAGIRTGTAKPLVFGGADASYHGDWGYYWDGSYWFRIDNESRWLRLLAEIKTPSIKFKSSNGGFDFSELNVFAGYEPNCYSISLSSVKECYWWGSYQTVSKLSTTTVDIWYIGVNFQTGSKGYYGKSSNERAGIRLYVINEMGRNEFTSVGKASKISFSWKSSPIVCIGLYFIY